MIQFDYSLCKEKTGFFNWERIIADDGKLTFSMDEIREQLPGAILNNEIHPDMLTCSDIRDYFIKIEDHTFLSGEDSDKLILLLESNHLTLDISGKELSEDYYVIRLKDLFNLFDEYDNSYNDDSSDVISSALNSNGDEYGDSEYFDEFPQDEFDEYVENIYKDLFAFYENEDFIIDYFCDGYDYMKLNCIVNIEEIFNEYAYIYGNNVVTNNKPIKVEEVSDDWLRYHINDDIYVDFNFEKFKKEGIRDNYNTFYCDYEDGLSIRMPGIDEDECGIGDTPLAWWCYYYKLYINYTNYFEYNFAELQDYNNDKRLLKKLKIEVFFTEMQGYVNYENFLLDE